MIVEEIFSHLSAHMIKGLMIHDQLASAYDFLNLRGYRKCHEYHYFEESKNYRCLQTYYSEIYHKVIEEEKIDNPEIIPQNWLKHTKMDVDANTKRSAIRELMKKWVDWESETKTLLEQSYKQLFELGEIGAAIKIKDFLEDNCYELAHAEEKQINLEMIGYDLVKIIDEQNSLYEEYCSKINKIFEDDEK